MSTRILHDLKARLRPPAPSEFSRLAGCADRVRSTAVIFVVGFFLDMAAVTHYGIAARIAQLFAELMLQSLGVVGPLLMRADALADREKVRRICSSRRA